MLGPHFIPFKLKLNGLSALVFRHGGRYHKLLYPRIYFPCSCMLIIYYLFLAAGIAKSPDIRHVVS